MIPTVNSLGPSTGWRVIFSGTTVYEPSWNPGIFPNGGRLRLMRDGRGLWVSADSITFAPGSTGQFALLRGLPPEWQASADNMTYPGAFYVLNGKLSQFRVDTSALIGNVNDVGGGHIRDVRYYPADGWPKTMVGI